MHWKEWAVVTGRMTKIMTKEEEEKLIEIWANAPAAYTSQYIQQRKKCEDDKNQHLIQ